MNKNHLKLIYLIGLLYGLTGTVLAQSKKEPVYYVDNFIGVRDEGSSCILGPQLPQGSINPSPHTSPGNSPYNMDCYNMEQPIRGFGQLHVSGTGWGQYGQILISPQTGLAIMEDSHDSPKSKEFATPFEYQVSLERYGIKTSVTSAVHSAIYRFTFPKSDQASIVLDATHSIIDIATVMKRWGAFLDGSVQIISKNGDELTGYGNFTGGFSDGPYKIYYSIKLSKVPIKTGTFINGKIDEGKKVQASTKKDDRIGAYFQFTTKQNEEIYLKVAVSLKSIEQATAWLNKEVPDWNYAKVKANAIKLWNIELNKIQIKSTSDKEKRIFYTALYHASVMPRDRTNDMAGFDNGVPIWDDHLAVWDTWRTLYPLKVLINPGMVSGTINSFIARQKKNNRVKDAYVGGSDMTDEQGGNNISNIIADAFVKKVEGVNWHEAYKLVKYQADMERNGITFGKPDSSKMYKQIGWIPAGKMSCSVTLEYAYNDFCAAEMAKKLGVEGDYNKYLNRSYQWINLWDPRAESDGYRGFIMPKTLNGDFINIDKKQNWGSWKNYFYEGNAWTYSYFVPHQFEKLVSLTGGKEKFTEKLNHGFENNFIDYGNEPAFLAVHAFHYAGRSDLSSFYVRKLMKDVFTEQGCRGNDDSGAMSSWFIFSSLGFFPNSGQNIYYLTGPSFPEATISLDNGKKIDIIAKNASGNNIYIQSFKLNGKPWKNFWFSHDDIANGARLEFVMGASPFHWFNDAVPSQSDDIFK